SDEPGAARRKAILMTTMDNTIFVDFHNADAEGYVRLNTNGTLADLSRLGIVLQGGMSLQVSDGEITISGTVRVPGAEGVWRLQVDWKEVFSEHAKVP
ncbi:MAG: hypothetical protein ACREUF_13715, partial [Solimonas sp.]